MGDRTPRGRNPRRGRGIRSARRRALVLTAVVICSGRVPSTSSAEDINAAVPFEDQGYTQRVLVGARPAGMAGAYVAAGDDVHSLVYNPAGLAQVRRIDLSIGFQYIEERVTSLFHGTSGGTPSSAMTLDALAIAYPVPTYRGSLVVAAGVYRVFSNQIDVLHNGFNQDTETLDIYRLQQWGSTYSYNLGFGVDLSPQISAGLNGFILHGALDSLTQFSYEFPGVQDRGEVQTVTHADEAELDLDGYGLTLGCQYHPHRLMHLGLSVTTPLRLSLSGTGTAETAIYRFNDTTEYFTDTYAVKTKHTIPFRVNGGVSLILPELTVSLEAGYSDWRQTEVDGSKLKELVTSRDLKPVFRQVFDVRVGVEYVVPVAPVRLRAGYARTPYALAHLQADRITQKDIQKAEVETERQTFAAGVGALLDRVLTIDASIEHQIGKRSIATLTDKRSSNRVALTASYRF